MSLLIADILGTVLDVQFRCSGHSNYAEASLIALAKVAQSSKCMYLTTMSLCIAKSN